MSLFDIERTLFYPHPRERVWRALTEREALAAWLMDNDFEPVVGHAFTMRMPPSPGWNGKVTCVVLAVDPPRHLSFSWQGRDGPREPTVVSYRLEQVEGGTRLLFSHRGFRGFGGAAESVILKFGVRRHYRVRLVQVLEALAAERA